MTTADLTVIPEALLAGLAERAETSLAKCEPLRWKSDAGVYLWLDARALARALNAELLRRVSVELADFDDST